MGAIAGQRGWDLSGDKKITKKGGLYQIAIRPPDADRLEWIVKIKIP